MSPRLVGNFAMLGDAVGSVPFLGVVFLHFDFLHLLLNMAVSFCRGNLAGAIAT